MFLNPKHRVPVFFDIVFAIDLGNTFSNINNLRFRIAAPTEEINLLSISGILKAYVRLGTLTSYRDKAVYAAFSTLTKTLIQEPVQTRVR